MDLNWWKNFLFSCLPKAPLFSSIKDRFFTSLVKSLGSVPKSAYDYNGQNLTDVHPETTTRADEWSDQFGFATTLSTSRLLAQWRQQGGQSPNYLQEQLHAAGYTNLFVHEWWVPGSSPVAARNPMPYINDFPPNNLLVNGIAYSFLDLPQCGDAYQCGDDLQCGDDEGIKFEEKIYPHPDVSEQYPFYFYVGAETWPDFAALTAEETEDVKRLIYKIKPMQQRCVLLSNSDVWVNTPTSGDEIWVNEPTTGTPIEVNIGDR